MNESLTQSLRRAAQVRPSGTATIDGDRRRTWREVTRRVASAAAGLRAIGVADGARVALLALNGDRFFESYYAIPWAGGAVVPLNTRLTAEDLNDIVDDAGVSVLCVDEHFAHLVPALRLACPQLRHVIGIGEKRDLEGALDWEALIAAHPPMADAGRHGTDLAAVCFTGGSTGRSKGVMLSHGNLVANAVNACYMIGYDASSVFLHAAPMCHLTDGMSTLAITMAAGTHVFVPRFDPTAVLDAIARHAITNVTLVPTMIAMLLDVPDIEGMPLESLRQIMFGAAPISDGTLARAVAIWPGMLFLHGYGMTELSPIATMLPLSMRRPAVAGSRLASCGQPMPNLELMIVDPDGVEVDRGTTGEIVVRGPTVMQGYWNRPAETAAALRDGWFHTGDAARMDDEGYVYIVDRLKDMIISGGENIYSTEVENALSTMPEIGAVAVIGIPDERWGERVHAVVVPRPGATVAADDIMAWARARLAAYKCPRSIELRAEPLPLSGAGKVLKRELRDPYWVGHQRNV